jgi:hypothetical protein
MDEEGKKRGDAARHLLFLLKYYSVKKSTSLFLHQHGSAS